MTIAIIGVGLIGGSIGLAARVRGLGRVVAFDAVDGVAQEAVRLGAADEAAGSFESAVHGADLVILATPPAQIVEALPRLQHCLTPGAVATDVGSVKTPVARTAQRLGFTRFVPSHPMAGRETHGLKSATPDLFDGATWPVTPLETSDDAALRRIEAFLSGLGARPLRLTPERHDSIVAVTSHVPHVLAYALHALARTARAGEPHLFDLAAGGFHSTTRVAASDPALWTRICLSNRENVARELATLRGRLDDVQAALDAGDGARLEELLCEGHRH
jgi:prephenate dehydrogenase